MGKDLLRRLSAPVIDLAKRRRIRILFEATTLAGIVGAKLVDPAASYTLERMAIGAGVGMLMGAAALCQAHIQNLEAKDAEESARQREAEARQENKEFITQWVAYAKAKKNEGQEPDIDQFLDGLE